MATGRPRLIAAEEQAKEKAAAAAAAAAEDESGDCVLITQIVQEVLADEPRPGTPAVFGPEAIVRIVALACEDPRKESGRPITHWTPPELADEAVKRGIVGSISPRKLRWGRFLGRVGFEAPPDTLLAKQRAISRS